MKLIRKEDHQELRTDLKESSVISNVMDDFPPICKQDPLEVRVMFIKEYYETTGQIIKISDIPDEMYGGALPIARNRKSLKRKMTEAEYLDATPKFDAKVAKTSAPETLSPASDMIIPQLEAQRLMTLSIRTLRMLLRSAPEIHLHIYLPTHQIYLKEPLTSCDRLMRNYKKPLNQSLTKLIQSTNHLFNTLPVTQPSFRTMERCLKGELRFATNSLPIILSNPLSLNPFR